MKTRKAFTLIELLVVISIIALLIAILMPALNRARNQAKVTLCKCNLRQLVFSFIYYAEDNEGKFPYKAGNSLSYPHIWWEAHHTSSPDNRYFFVDYLDGFVLQERGMWTEGVDFAPEVMYCPSVANARQQHFGFGRQWPTRQYPNWRPFETSYQYFNLGWLKDNAGLWRSRAKMPTRISDKSCLPLWGDLIEIYGSSINIYDPRSTFRQVNHFDYGFGEFVPVSSELPEGMNIAHVDGSVEWYNYDKTEVYWTMGGIQNVWGKLY